MFAFQFTIDKSLLENFSFFKIIFKVGGELVLWEKEIDSFPLRLNNKAKLPEVKDDE